MSATTIPAVPFNAIIIGAGFGGIGMAIALKKAGQDSFVILEKSHDVGGVWRDNTYPGAACDVPSHLYSFSFEPNPGWSRAFATQPEIHAYLRHCADQYGLHPHLRLGAQVEQASFDETASLWSVTLGDGTSLSAHILIPATGQLSRPVLPDLEGIDAFRGRAFHSAHWDHGCELEGKRVAVIGTGASAIQFVPAIADRVDRLTVFQRSPAYVLPRPDRAYSSWERAMFRHLPWTTRLYRAGIYLKYESRALAFTRLRGLMKVAVGMPFRRLLARQVPDPALRAQLVPDYPIGCKRILLSSDYLAALAKPNVALVTQGIRRITAEGIETVDGKRHPADVIVYGTGFAATEFLAPMRIVGQGGVSLDDAWKKGAEAWLGVAMPGFPNFFMIYGPNTNLGHNSIVYMIESQVGHVMRCLKAMQRAGAETIEVDPQLHRRFNRRIQQRLARTVWNGCKSWYVDAAGHNSTNWPGFTLSYRWLTNYGGLQAYTLGRRSSDPVETVSITAPEDWLERINANMVRLLLRTCFRPFVGPPWGARMQRFVVGLLSPLMPGIGGTVRSRQMAGVVPVEVVTPAQGEDRGAILYLHGGAFCLGSPETHRSITTRLAATSNMAVWVPDYRLAPEHPYPAALEDALACYELLLGRGIGAEKIVLAGDSAGGALALALAIRLKERGAAMPAGLMLVSPVTDPGLTGGTLDTKRRKDPMVREGWIANALRWYACPASVGAHRPLDADLSGLPPMLVQVGEDEILLADATRLARRAATCGVPCRLEIHERRWHVFHLSSFYLRSARFAVGRLAVFAAGCVQERPSPVKLVQDGQQQQELTFT